MARSFFRGLPLLGTIAFAEHVWLNQTAGSWQVVSDEGLLGFQGTVRGAGGFTHLSAAAASGAEALRTWDFDQLNDTIEEAESLGLKFSAGIWLSHNKSDYEDCSDMDDDPYWQTELDRVLQGVRAFKASPSILWWTVGNEIEFATEVTKGSDCTWRRLEWLVQKVKEEDPMHPVGTVLAGAHDEKVKNGRADCHVPGFPRHQCIRGGLAEGWDDPAASWSDLAICPDGVWPDRALGFARDSLGLLYRGELHREGAEVCGNV